MRMYKIGEIAKLLGLTTQALRYYEQVGIVEPQKSENGTRYFTESELVRLMAFKRFQLIDFTVQEVADHFTRGSLDSLMLRMEETSARMKQESAQILRRAEAVDRFAQMLRITREGVGGMVFMMRPELYVHPCTLAELDSMNDGQRESFEWFVNAMPEAHICFQYDPGKSGRPVFRFAITEKHLQGWSTQPEEVVRMPGCPCVRLIVRTDIRLWDTAYLEEQAERVRAAGYTVDERLPVIGQQVVSENAGKQRYLIAAIYVPVCE